MPQEENDGSVMSQLSQQMIAEEAADGGGQPPQGGQPPETPPQPEEGEPPQPPQPPAGEQPPAGDPPQPPTPPQGGQPEGEQAQAPEGDMPPAGEEPEGGTPPQTDDPQAEYNRAVSAQIFQETEGRAESVEDLLSLTKELSEKANKQPVLNMDLLKNLDQQLRKEKGYDLSTAMAWNNLNVSKLTPQSKFKLAMIASDPDKPDSHYEYRAKEFAPILNWTEEQRQEALEDKTITQQGLEKLQVDYDTIMHRADEKIEAMKSQYQVSLNFEPKDETPAGPTPEQLSEAKTGLSQALKGLSEVTHTVTLPNELGDFQVSVPVTNDQKADLMKIDDSLNRYSGFKNEDGSIDFQRYVRAAHLEKNFDKIIAYAAVQASTEALKRHIAKKDNVDAHQSQRHAPTPENDPYVETLQRMQQDRAGRAN